MLVIAHDLEFKAPGGLVVTDDFENRRLFLVADKQPVLQRCEAGFGRAVYSDDNARKIKKVGCGGRALQRTPERNQRDFEWRQAAGVGLDLRVKLA